jgi:mono/diheme cytochrome c family protein
MSRKTVFAMIAGALLMLGAACSSSPSGSASNAVEADIAASRTAGPVSSAPGAPVADRSRDLRAKVPAPDASPASVPASPSAAQGASTSAFANGAAMPGDPDKGRRFALENCRPCHVVARDQSSPVRFADAPAFAAIANAAATTPTGLNVWLTNPHPSMPSLVLTPAESADVIAYIMSLRDRR